MYHCKQVQLEDGRSFIVSTCKGSDNKLEIKATDGERGWVISGKDAPAAGHQRPELLNVEDALLAPDPKNDYLFTVDGDLKLQWTFQAGGLEKTGYVKLTTHLPPYAVARDQLMLMSDSFIKMRASLSVLERSRDQLRSDLATRTAQLTALKEGQDRREQELMFKFSLLLNEKAHKLSELHERALTAETQLKKLQAELEGGSSPPQSPRHGRGGRQGNGSQAGDDDDDPGAGGEAEEEEEDEGEGQEGGTYVTQRPGQRDGGGGAGAAAGDDSRDTWASAGAAASGMAHLAVKAEPESAGRSGFGAAGGTQRLTPARAGQHRLVQEAQRRAIMDAGTLPLPMDFDPPASAAAAAASHPSTSGAPPREAAPGGTAGGTAGGTVPGGASAAVDLDRGEDDDDDDDDLMGLGAGGAGVVGRGGDGLGGTQAPQPSQSAVAPPAVAASVKRVRPPRR